MASISWRLIVCGLSHKSSTTDQRAPLQLGNDRIAQANSLFGNLPGVMESVILSTCNRIEFYLVWTKPENPFEAVQSFYKQFKDLDISGLGVNFYTKKDIHAAKHLFEVASGIDSMVLGENQILGQVKTAYSSACAVKTAGKVIHRLFHQSFRVGKQVRSETALGRGTCSVSSAAMGLLKTKIGKLKRPSILFIGINQVIAMAASSLGKMDYGQIMFANRTVAKAVEFAAKLNATAHSLDELPSLIAKSDMVITCTGSEHPIITQKMIKKIIVENPEKFDRQGKKLIIMDLAVPPDVEIDDNCRPAIDFYGLQDVQKYINGLQEDKMRSILLAEEIIDRRLAEFIYWYDHVRHEPVYNGLDNTFETIRKQEMKQVLETLSLENKDEVNRATIRLVNRLLQIKIRTADKKISKD